MVRKNTSRYTALENYLLETINEELIDIDTEDQADEVAATIIRQFSEDLVILLDGYVSETLNMPVERGH